MIIEVKIPSVGESVTEALLAEWFKKDGDTVQKDDVLFVIETDKVTLEVAAEAAGTLHIQVPEGETVSIGTVVATIDTAGAAAAPEPAPAAEPVSWQAWQVMSPPSVPNWTSSIRRKLQLPKYSSDRLAGRC